MSSYDDAEEEICEQRGTYHFSGWGPWSCRDFIYIATFSEYAAPSNRYVFMCLQLLPSYIPLFRLEPPSTSVPLLSVVKYEQINLRSRAIIVIVFLSELHSFSRLFIRMFFSMAASRLARADAHHHIHHGRMPWFDVFMIGIIIIIVIGSIRGKHHLLFSPLIALSI